MANKDENKTWTTWEELLLACAVKRHGFKDWDSVSMEIQNRSSLPYVLVTPQNCQKKYHDLKRRFHSQDDDQNHLHGDSLHNIPWLEELRQRRVAELRREVHLYDVSILSLQSKVKRLTEERERSFRAQNNGDERPDLEKSYEGDRSENGRHIRISELRKPSPEIAAGKSNSGGESDRENQSVNESNSTGLKCENRESGLEHAAAANERKPVRAASTKPDPAQNHLKQGNENSCNESSDSIARDLTAQNGSKRPQNSNSVELRGSASELKSEEEGTKDSSDLQSSASLTRRRQKKGSTSGGDEPEAETGCRSIDPVSVKSHPLNRVLELIRSHKHGSVFARRLRSQETDEYKSTIRRHMDLETIHKRLKEGSYISSSSKFYRDLFLLFSNAIVFFPKNSHEHAAAHQLRRLVLEQLNKQLAPKSESPKSGSPALPVLLSKPKSELQRSDSLLAKDKSSGFVIACRKRSSKFSDAKRIDAQRKSVPDEKSLAKVSSVPGEEPTPPRISTKERSVTGTRSSRRNSRAARKNQKVISSPIDKAETAGRSEEQKTDAQAIVKKKGAADFLKRIAQNSTLEKMKKSCTSDSSRDGGKGGAKEEEEEEERRPVDKRDGRRDKAFRQISLRKQVMKEESSPSKRNVGRPPKSNFPAKRRREGGGRGELEVSGLKRPIKRSRR